MSGGTEGAASKQLARASRPKSDDRISADDRAIAVGETKNHRARVLFDGPDQVTPTHKKSLRVRLERIYRPRAQFARYLVPCETKSEAKQIETMLHRDIGGDSGEIPTELKEAVLRGLGNDSKAGLFLRLAMISAFSGLDDLRRWEAGGFLDQHAKDEIVRRLALNPATFWRKQLKGCKRPAEKR